MLASTCLVYGAMKEKRKFITPWLVITTLLLITYFIIVNISLFLVIAAGSSMAFSLSGFISVVLTVYFLIVVYSYHASFNASNSTRTPGGGHVVTYTVEDHHYPGHSMVVIPPQELYPQNFTQQVYPQNFPQQGHFLHQGYPQNFQPVYLQDYPQQPPPYENPGTCFTGPASSFPQTRDEKLQP